MFNPFAAADHTDEMDFDPLKSRIKFRHDMRNALCPFPGEDALDRSTVPSLLCLSQIYLEVTKQTACAVRHTGDLRVRNIRAIGVVVDPIRQRRAMDEISRNSF